jgi:hypothetical protein
MSRAGMHVWVLARAAHLLHWQQSLFCWELLELLHKHFLHVLNHLHNIRPCSAALLVSIGCLKQSRASLPIPQRTKEPCVTLAMPMRA